MDWQWLLLVVTFQFLIKDITCKDITIQVNPRKLIQYVPERFLSMTVDPGTILLAGNLENAAALNMAKGLSPSFVRLGGKSTNYIKFGKELFMDNTTITEEQWDSVNRFVRVAGLDLITSINPTERINGVWDSRDALQLISYSQKQGYNVAWQLGYDTEGITAPGAEVGRDVVRLRKILDGFSRFTRSPIFAPDFPFIQNPKDAQFVRDLMIQAGPVLGAIFIQPPFKHEEDPARSIMNAIISLDSNVWGKALRIGRIIPRKPIWIAEKEISKGTSEDAINLAVRLGVAARIGVQIVMRQVGPLSLKHPTPEFWVALMYKNLVGRGVLDARVHSGLNRTELQIFSHCGQSLPRDRSIIDDGLVYEKGAVTVYGVNNGNENIKINLKAGMKEEKVHVYSLTFSEENDMPTEETYLNGQRLTLSPEGDLPLVSPRVVMRPSKTGIIIPPRSVFFFVLPDVKSRVCAMSPAISHEVQEVQDMASTRKLIQVAAEVLNKPGNSFTPPSEEEEPGKSYVKFTRKSTISKDSKTMPKTEVKFTTEIAGKTPEITTVIPSTAAVTESESDNIIGTTDAISIDSAVKSSRRKRSADLKSPAYDMEVSATNDYPQPSHNDLVKYFNSYAQKVYESARSGKDSETEYMKIPDEIWDFMKNHKISFKPIPAKVAYSTATPSEISEDTVSTVEPASYETESNADEKTTRQEYEADAERNEEVLSDSKDENEQPLPEETPTTKFNEVKLTDAEKEALSEAVKDDYQADKNEENGLVEEEIIIPDNSSRDESSTSEKVSEGKPEEAKMTEEVILLNNPLADSGVTSEYIAVKPSPKTQEETIDEDGVAKVIEEDGTSSFRKPNGEAYEPSDTEVNAVEREESLHEADIRSEAEFTPESSSTSENQPKDRIPRDESLREGESAAEPSSNGGFDGEEGDRRKLGSEAEDADEPPESEGSAKGNEQSSPASYSVVGSSALNSPKITSEDDEDTSQDPTVVEKPVANEYSDNIEIDSKNNVDKNQKESDTSEDNSEVSKDDKAEAEAETEDAQKEQESPVNESEGASDSAKNNQLDVTYSLEGFPQKQVDKLLLEMAKGKFKNEEFVKTSDKSEKDNAINQDDSNSIKKTYDENKDTTEKAVIIPQNEITGEIVEKNPKDDVEILSAKNDDENEESDLEGVSNASLKDGPAIPDSNSPETGATKREIALGIENDTGNRLGGQPVLIVLDPNVKAMDSIETEKEEVENKNDKSSEDIDKIESGDLKLDGPEKSLLKSTSSSDDNQELKPLPIPSFKNLPLENIKDRSYNELQKTSYDVSDNGAKESDTGEKNDKNLSVVTVPLQTVMMPVESSLTSAPSTELLDSSTESENSDDKTPGNPAGGALKKEELSGVISKMKEDAVSKLESLMTAERKRQETLEGIKRKIAAVRERFKHLTRDENWRSELQQKGGDLRSLLSQEKDLRKKLLRIHQTNAQEVDVPLSRPRRLTYYPQDDISTEDSYDYTPRRTESYTLPLSGDYDKSYLNDGHLSSALRREHNHVIFPLDLKTPQAVVYNNKIIPAKLYGVVNINDSPSSSVIHSKPVPSSVIHPKPVIEPASDSFFQKYYTKSYDSANKYSPQISPAASYKSHETYSIPKDSLYRTDDSSYLPVVVLSPNSNIARRKRSIPVLPSKKYIERKKLSYAEGKHVVKKRSINSHETIGKHTTTDIPKVTIKDIISNEITPESIGTPLSYKIYRPSNQNQNYGFIDQYLGAMPYWSSNGPMKGRTFDLPLAPPPPFPEPLPDPHRALPPPNSLPPPPDSLPLPPEPLPPYSNFPSEPLPPPPFPPHPLPPPPHFPQESFPPSRIFNDIPDLPPPPPTSSHAEKREPDGTQAFLMTIIQDKFRSLMGMLDTLGVWCGANPSK